MPDILRILKLLLELWLLIYLWKMRGNPHFSFWIPINLVMICSFLNSQYLGKNSFLLGEAVLDFGRKLSEKSMAQIK